LSLDEGVSLEKGEKDSLGYLTKEQAIARVDERLEDVDGMDLRTCFVYDTENPKKGWRDHNPYPCAHYVAHVKVIKVSHPNWEHCTKGYAVKVAKVIEYCRNNWTKKARKDVEVGDIWVKKTETNKTSHTGIVCEVSDNKKRKILIEHLSSDGMVLKTSEHNGWLSGGEFYGPIKKTRWLGNKNRGHMEIHDLKNVKGACNVDRMNDENKVYFKSVREALEKGFNGCYYCLPKYHTE